MPPRFYQLLDQYGKAYLKSTENTDARLCALPHPKRVQLNDALALEAEFLRTFAPRAYEIALSPSSSRLEIANEIYTGYPELSALVFQDDQDVLFDIATRLMLHAKRIHLFQTTDALEALLHDSDFGRDVPAQWVQSPFPNVYLEFGQTRSSPFSIQDPQSGSHIVEGCYLLSAPRPRFGQTNRDGLVRSFDIVIFGSPLGKRGVMDDAFVTISLPIEDENASIEATVERAIQYYRLTDGEFLNQEVFGPVMQHVAKILVYLNTPDARRRPLTEASESRARLASIKSPAKRAKATRQSDRLYDRIVVGPETLPSDYQAGSQGHGPVRPHVRRGHIRAQAYGPQHSLRRPQWIQPVMVGKGALTATPEYLVR